MDIVGIIHKENGSWGISFPDLPGCISAADSRHELLKQAQEALALHVWGMEEAGERLPLLRSEAELRAAAEFDEDFANADEVLAVPLPEPAEAIAMRTAG
jgi:predicted RNase H-like HicB family nuclease